MMSEITYNLNTNKLPLFILIEMHLAVENLLMSNWEIAIHPKMVNCFESWNSRVKDRGAKSILTKAISVW